MHIKYLTYFQRNNVIRAEHDIILQLYISKLKLNKLNNTGRNFLPTWE